MTERLSLEEMIELGKKPLCWIVYGRSYPEMYIGYHKGASIQISNIEKFYGIIVCYEDIIVGDELRAHPSAHSADMKRIFEYAKSKAACSGEETIVNRRAEAVNRARNLLK